MEQSNGTQSRPFLYTSTALDISLSNERMVTPQLVVTMNTLSSMRHKCPLILLFCMTLPRWNKNLVSKPEPSTVFWSLFRILSVDKLVLAFTTTSIKTIITASVHLTCFIWGSSNLSWLL